MSTEQTAEYKNSVICEGIFNQFHQSTHLLITKTSINGHGATENTLPELKSVFHQIFQYVLQDLHNNFIQSSENKAHWHHFKIPFYDFHDGIFLPLIDLYYGSTVHNIFNDEYGKFLESFRVVKDILVNIENGEAFYDTSCDSCDGGLKESFKYYHQFSLKVIDLMASDRFIDPQLIAAASTTTLNNNNNNNNNNNVVVTVQPVDYEKESKLKMLKFFQEFLFQKANLVITYYNICEEGEKANLLSLINDKYKSLFEGKDNSDIVDDSVNTKALIHQASFGSLGSDGIIQVFFTNLLKHIKNGKPLEKWF